MIDKASSAAAGSTTPGAARPAGAVCQAGGLGSRAEPVAMRVTEVYRLSERLLHLGFRREDGGTFAFRPGQFCRVAVPTATGGSVWRSYSIATPATEDAASETCEIAVTAMPGGLATAYLFGLRVGDRLEACGPFGRLVLPATDPAQYLLIGTGTGMAPYRAMLPELERRAIAAGGALRVTLVMGVRGPGEALYAEDFRNFVDHAPGRWRLLVSYSRTLPVQPEWFETRGYVQDRLPGLELSPADDRILLCGNPEMIDVCSERLIQRGFDKTALVREKYLAGPAPR